MEKIINNTIKTTIIFCFLFFAFIIGSNNLSLEDSFEREKQKCLDVDGFLGNIQPDIKTDNELGMFIIEPNFLACVDIEGNILKQYQINIGNIQIN